MLKISIKDNYITLDIPSNPFSLSLERQYGIIKDKNDDIILQNKFIRLFLERVHIR